MNLPPLPLVEGAFIIDNSGLELLQTCARAHEYNRLRKRILAAGKPALDFGSAIHLALEWRYRNCKNDSPGVFDEDEQADVLSTFFAEHPMPEDDFRNLNYAMELIKRYNIKYAIEPFNLMEYAEPIACGHCEGKGWSQPHLNTTSSELDKEATIPCPFCQGTGENSVMVELPFLLPLFTYEVNGFPPIPILYSGRIDLPVTWDEQLIIIDHKTTSMIGGNYFEEAKLSAQQQGYAWAFEQLTGQKVGGYCINALRSKDVPQYVRNGKSYNGTTAAQWWEESLQRDITYLRPNQLEEWKHNTIELIHRFFWHYIRGYFPMETKWCFGKFGKCPYFETCILPPESRETMLMSDRYTNNEWSPLVKVKPSQT